MFRFSPKSIGVAIGVLLVAVIGIVIFRSAKDSGPLVELEVVASSTLNTYRNAQYGFEIQYPSDFDDSPTQNLAAEDLDGLPSSVMLKVTFPERYHKGTNLSAATIYAGAKKVSQESTCWKIFGNEVEDYGNGKAKYEDVTVGEMIFRRATVGEGAAGNLYDITRYAAVKEGTCFLLSLIAHSKSLSVLREKNPTIKAYDPAPFRSAFEEIVQTFRVIKTGTEEGRRRYEDQELGIAFEYLARFTKASPSAPWSRYNGTSTIVALENFTIRANIPDELLIVSRFPIPHDSSAERVIIENTYLDPSGVRPSFSDFKKRKVNGKEFHWIRTTRFEGTLGFAYYHIAAPYVYRFDSIAQGMDWTNPTLSEENDKVHAALRQMLQTLKFF
ncbi:MAG: hypothetical protein FJY98_00285 [Candidatus Liptonbacteria bacterium]|nr:hypothetical protein [Candidatus Liptonbacteria bacterium]